MPRIFVSYRRADSMYPVGWIAERLRTIDGVDDVQATFHDSQLRTGDDFADALEGAIAEADIVVAVIGPEWMGPRPDGPSRIQDPDDWVLREIATAMRQGKRVLPVLVEGAELPMTSELHESIAELPRLHTTVFSDMAALDDLEAHIASHLREIDEARARREGLDRPVIVEPPAHWKRIMAAAVVLGVVATLVTAAVWRALLPERFEASDLVGRWQWATAPVVGVLVWAVCVGLMLDRWVLRVARFRRREVGLFALLMLVVLPLAVVNFISVDNDVAFGFWAGMVLVFGVTMIVLVATMAITTTEPIAAPAQLARRVVHIRTLAAARRWGTGVVMPIGSMGVASAVMSNAVDDSLDVAEFSVVRSLSMGVLITGIASAFFVWTGAKLAAAYADVERDVGALPSDFARNADLDLERDVHPSGWPRMILGLPILVAAIAVAAAVA